MFHVEHCKSGNKEVETMKPIEVKVTSVPRAGGTVLLIECSACGPVAVDSRTTSTSVGAGGLHLTLVHDLLGKVQA